MSALLFEGADWSFETIQRIHDRVEEIALGELRLLEPGATQIGHAETGPAQIGPGEVSAHQILPSEIGRTPRRHAFQPQVMVVQHLFDVDRIHCPNRPCRNR